MKIIFHKAFNTAFAALVFFLFLSLPCLYASTAGKVNAGNKLYKKGEYDKSLEQYREAQISAPDNAGVRYNMGNSLFRLDNFDEAAQEYKNAATVKDKRLQSAAYYNLGNTAYKQQKTDEALEYYKKALALDPKDEDAKYNYEYLLRQKSQPQSKDKQKDQKKKDQQQKNRQNSQGKDKDKEKDQQQQNKSGMSKEDAQRILQVYDDADKDAAKKRKMMMPQLPQTDEDW